MTGRPDAGEGRERDHEGREAGGRGPVLKIRTTRERSRRSGLSHRGRGEGRRQGEGKEEEGRKGELPGPDKKTSVIQITIDILEILLNIFLRAGSSFVAIQV